MFAGERYTEKKEREEKEEVERVIGTAREWREILGTKASIDEKREDERHLEKRRIEKILIKN